MRGFTFSSASRVGHASSFAPPWPTANRQFLIACLASLSLLLPSAPVAAQVFTVTPQGVTAHDLEFHPTDIPLPQQPLTRHNREDLLRFLQAEQGFTMRALPVATLTLHANGEMHPSGSDYAALVHEHGVAAAAGDRVSITDLRIERDRIVLDFNGGPEHKHKILRHISLGTDPDYTAPVVHEDDTRPSGTRVTLVFPRDVPDLTGPAVEALLKPVVDFSVKSPQQAYTDTLPDALRKTILAHHVLVGMNQRMVLSALGAPLDKVRETEEQTPFEEWIYGEPPEPVQFVRFNGNRVIRIEVARVGEPPEIRTSNEMGTYWDGKPADNVRIVKLGDAPRVQPSGESAPHAPPTLRLPGEATVSEQDKNTPQMKPVEFPKDSGSSTAPARPGDSSASSSGTVPASSPVSTPSQTAPIHPTMPSPE